MTRDAGWLERLARRAVLSQLAAVRDGSLELIEGDRRHSFGTAAQAESPAVIRVHDPAFYTKMALGGSIGAAEAYTEEFWTTDDLTAVVRLVARKSHLNDGMERGLARPLRALHRAYHRVRRNSRTGSRTNIAAHYDLGNEFFASFLDDTMMYSCAVFERDDTSLAEASRAKNDLICRKLELGPEDDLLEIGTGWGGFAVHAAAEYGCQVVTTTISQEQDEFATNRIAEAGLSDRVTVLRTDYRDLPRVLGRRFDKLVSIEMIEAVGERYLGSYLNVCSDLLEPDGMMLIQSIVMGDQQYGLYRRSVDFIQRYIFPGGFLPSVSALTDRMRTATDLRLFHLEDITPHYALTLRRWRERFTGSMDSLREMGFSDDFFRLWEFYFCYCEGGFAERVIGDVQLLLTKPLNRRRPVSAHV